MAKHGKKYNEAFEDIVVRCEAMTERELTAYYKEVAKAVTIYIGLGVVASYFLVSLIYFTISLITLGSPGGIVFGMGGAILYILGIAYLIAILIKYIISEYIEKNRNPQPNVIKTWIKAKKEKYCPLIEFEK